MNEYKFKFKVFNLEHHKFLKQIRVRVKKLWNILSISDLQKQRENVMNCGGHYVEPGSALTNGREPRRFQL